MGGCEQRIEVIVCENAKKVRSVGVGSGGGMVGGSGGCKLRIEGIVKWGVRVQSGVSECMVNEGLKRCRSGVGSGWL